MPNPTLYDVHVNRPLSNLSIAYIADATDYVASGPKSVFPNVPSQNKSDMYYIYSKADFYRNEMKERASGTESAGGGYRLTDATFTTRVYALHDDVSDQVRSNSDSVLQPDADAVAYLTQQAMIKKEVDWAAAYFTTGVWGTNLTGQTGSSNIPGNVVQYWNLSTATPIEDITTVMKNVKLAGTKLPNKLVLGYSAWLALKNCPEIVDRIKYTTATSGNPTLVTKQTVAQLLGLEDVLVMEAIQNIAHEGQTANMAFIGDKAALLVYAAPKAGIKMVSGGYTFSWAGFFGAGPAGNRIKKFRMEHLESDRIEIEMAYQFAMIDNQVGAFFSSVTQ